ncbi:hypothetical protein R6Q59_035425 [Mikania micrantha]
MANLLSSTGVQVETIMFPPHVKPPGATNTLFLGGAGVRCVEIESKLVKISGIGVYLEDKAIQSLAATWKGKGVEELQDSEDFFKDIINGPFDKFIQVTTIIPLAGKQFSKNVSANCERIWKAQGTYNHEDAKTIEKFNEVFKDQNFPPGSSILLTISRAGSLTISFSKDGSIQDTMISVLENEKIGPAMVETAIGKHGFSPEAKKSVASRLSTIIN